MILALILPALADAAMAPCMGYYAYDSLPRPGAIDVPLDVAPTLLITDGGCPAAMSFELALYRLGDAGEELVGSEEVPLAGRGPFVVPFSGWGASGGLEADQDYVLRVSPLDGSGEASELGFSTGSGSLSGYEGAPVTVLETADASRSSGSWFVSGSVAVAPVADPDGLSLMVIPHPEAPDQLLDAQVIGTARELTSFIGFQANEAPDALCVTARQLNGALEVVGESEPSCLEPEIHRNVSGGRCSTGPVAPHSLLVLGLSALALRRRR